MANNLYDDSRYKMMSASFNWGAIDLMLVAWSGTPSYIATEKTVQAIVNRGYTVRSTSTTITSKTIAADGTGQTNQVVLPAVAIGPNITWFTMVKKLGTTNASELILFVDTAETFPFVANGLDLVVQPDWLTKRGWFKP